MYHLRNLAVVDLGVIQKNFLVLSEQAQTDFLNYHGLVAMVKANAYGHGLGEVSQGLMNLARNKLQRLLAFGVASFQEAILLRNIGIDKPIWIFSDSTPFHEMEYKLCKQFLLTPVLHSLSDLKRLISFEKNAAKKISIQLKINTGLNRLGIDQAEVCEAARLCLKNKIKLEGVFSHLASAEKSFAPETKSQWDVFTWALGQFSLSDGSYIHISNTAGLSLKVAHSVCNVARPGIGLYGYGHAHVQPALKLLAKVIKIRDLDARQYVGYGASFQTKKKMTQWVLAHGYADGFLRSLSRPSEYQGQDKLALQVSGYRSSSFFDFKPIFNPRRASILGRVSMDLTSLAFEKSLTKHELKQIHLEFNKSRLWLGLLGENQEQGELLSATANTIIYEILTSISARVPRLYAQGGRRAR